MIIGPRRTLVVVVVVVVVADMDMAMAMAAIVTHGSAMAPTLSPYPMCPRLQCLSP